MEDLQALDQRWTAFQSSLAAQLTALKPYEFLILAIATRPEHYVQFVRSHTGDTLVGECSGYPAITGRPPLSHDQVRQIADLGWEFPLDGGESYPNFRRLWDFVDPAQVTQAARLACMTLRHVLEAVSPSYLRLQRGNPKG